MRAVVHLLGASEHKGDFDGRPYAYSRLYVLSPLDATNPARLGFGVVEYRCPIELFGDLRGRVNGSELSFPVLAEVDVEMMAVGKGDSKLSITQVHRLSQGAAGAWAEAA